MVTLVQLEEKSPLAEETQPQVHLIGLSWGLINIEISFWVQLRHGLSPDRLIRGRVVLNTRIAISESTDAPSAMRSCPVRLRRISMDQVSGIPHVSRIQRLLLAPGEFATLTS